MHKSESNCIVYSVYNEMKGSIVDDFRDTFWLTKLKYLIEQNAFAEVWMCPDSVNVKLSILFCITIKLFLNTWNCFIVLITTSFCLVIVFA